MELYNPFGKNRPVLLYIKNNRGKGSILYPSAFMVSLAIGIQAFTMIFFMKDVYNASPFVVSLLPSTLALCYLSGCFLLRPIGKKIIPRRSMMIAVGGMAFFIMLIVISENIFLTFLFNCLYGFSMAFFWPPLMGWLSAGREGDVLNKALSRFSLSWSTGAVFSPFIAGVLVEIDLYIALVISAFILISVLFYIIIMSGFLIKVKIDKYISHDRNLGEITIDKSTPLRFACWAGVVSTYSVIGIILNVLPLYMRDTLNIKESSIGIILLNRSLFQLAGFYILGRSRFWQFNKKLIISAQIFMLIIIILLAFAESFLYFFVIMIIFGFIISLNYQNSVFHGVSGSIDREKRMTVHEAILNVGSFVGSIGGALLYQYFSLHVMYISLSVLIIFTIIVQSLVIRLK